MSDLWNDICEAIATKANASTGARAAGLRKANTNTDDIMSPPELKVLDPSVEMQDQTADTERFDMTVTSELIVPTPAGNARASRVWSAIARALQLEWRSGITLGMSTRGVWYSGIVSIEPTLTEYQDTGLDGCTIKFLVRVHETVSPSRTA